MYTFRQYFNVHIRILLVQRNMVQRIIGFTIGVKYILVIQRLHFFLHMTCIVLLQRGYERKTQKNEIFLLLFLMLNQEALSINRNIFKFD